MALMIFTVTPDDGEEFEVEAASRDLARWEQSGRGRTLASLQQNPTIAEIYRICWIAMERLERAGRLKLPDGVADYPSLMDTCDVTSRPAEGLEHLAGPMGGGAYPPGQ